MAAGGLSSSIGFATTGSTIISTIGPGSPAGAGGAGAVVAGMAAAGMAVAVGMAGVADVGDASQAARLREVIAADCPRMQAGEIRDACGVHFPQLPELFG
jgi:hypothetical protein